MKKITLVLIGLLVNVSFAQLSFDRSRVIFDASRSNSQSVIVNNQSDKAPYLAQTWIEDENGVKIVSPLAALPILQRVNPLQEKQVKVSFMGSAAELPADRESLFFLNVLGVPPKGDPTVNEVTIVIQNKIKLFYRPKGLSRYEHNGWAEEMIVKKAGNSITIENPTPYYNVIYGITDSRNRVIEQDINLKPFGSKTVNIKVGNKFDISVIDDYGASMDIVFTCNGNTCTGKQKDKK